MTDNLKLDRRDFLKQAAGVMGAAMHTDPWTAASAPPDTTADQPRHQPTADVSYPRRFPGRQLRMISFPLGGVAAGSIGLGGRGQLINWEIFNRPNKGFRPPYAFPPSGRRLERDKPVARVLESRILPPYEGQDGLGSNNVPGLSRLESATFTGEYPLAHIDFEDRSLPVKVALDAFSPFIPHEPDDSGLPVAILRYRVTNPGPTAAKSPSRSPSRTPSTPRKTTATTRGKKPADGRKNEVQTGKGIAGLGDEQFRARCRRSHGRRVRAGCARQRRRGGLALAGLARRPLVECPAAFLGPVFNDPATRRATRTAQSGRRALPQRLHSSTANSELRISPRLAVSQSHARLDRMGRAAGRGQNRHRQLLCGSLQERMGSRRAMQPLISTTSKRARACSSTRCAKARCPRQ